MVILERVLEQLGIRKTQRKFLLLLVRLWLVLPGRVNYANLGRFSGKSEKTFRNWFRKPFDFMAVTSCLVRLAQASGHFGKTLALVIDSSQVRKSGKHTPGLGKYWESKQGKAVFGLEVSCCAVVDVAGHYALPLDAIQTPATLPKGESRLDHYIHHLSNVLNNLPVQRCADIAYVVGDAYYTKKDFIDAVVKAEKHFIGKLRCDANLKYLYDGNPTGKPGRPKLYAGKVAFQDFSQWQLVSQAQSVKQTTSTYTTIVFAVALKRKIRVVCVLITVKGKTSRHLFFSTDIDLAATTILAFYQARFQIEFCFRDAKQFAGLLDCQSRQDQAINFHWNMAFLTVTLARFEQLALHPHALDSFVFSLEDVKRRAYNEFFAEKIFRFLPFHHTFSNFKHRLDSLLNLGVKAA
jgi:Transposase DDE domain